MYSAETNFGESNPRGDPMMPGDDRDGLDAERRWQEWRARGTASDRRSRRQMAMLVSVGAAVLSGGLLIQLF